jgi:hypothetical protein
MSTERDITISLKISQQEFLNGLKQAGVATEKFESKSKSLWGEVAKGTIVANAVTKGFNIAKDAMMNFGKQAIELDARMVRMRIDSGMSTEQMIAFKEELLTAGNATGNTIAGMTDLGESALKSSKSIGFVKDNMAFMARVMKATGADGKELGDVMGDIYEKTGLTGKALEDVVANLYAFGKTKGREKTFKEMLPNMGELIKAAKRTFPKGDAAKLSEFVTTSMFTGAPGAVEAAYKKMPTKKYREYLEKALGFNITKSGLPSLLQVAEKINKTFKTTEARNNALVLAFGKSGQELYKLITETEDYKTSLTDAQKNQQALNQDYKTARATLESSLNALNTAGVKIISEAMGPAMEEITKALNSITPEQLHLLAEALRDVGKAVGESLKALMFWISFAKDPKNALKNEERAASERFYNPTREQSKEDFLKRQAKQRGLTGLDVEHYKKYFPKEYEKNVADFEASHPVSDSGTVVVNNINVDKEGKVTGTTTVTDKNGEHMKVIK